MHRVAVLVAGALCACVVPELHAQSCSLVTDIDTRPLSGISSAPRSARSRPDGTSVPGFLKCGRSWFFVASTPATGAELWRTDGTVAGTALVKDINPGPRDSSPSELTCCNGIVYFRASTAANGAELWRSDGTANGTALVKDIRPGPASSSPVWLECLAREVLFAANDGRSGPELWKSDGTAIGTVMVKDLVPGPSGSAPFAMHRSSTGKEIYFAATDRRSGFELWKSNGKTSGTVLVKDIQPGRQSSLGLPPQFRNHRGKTLFRAWGPNGVELWQTDGTAPGTIELKDVRPGPRGSSPSLSETATIGKDLFFVVDDGKSGAELWKTDGTTAGTSLAADVAPGPQGSFPAGLLAQGTTLYFAATVPGLGRELWSLRGGKASLVRDVAPGSRSSRPSHLANLGSRVVFQADDGIAGAEPWTTDGTAAGTTRLRDIWPGSPGSSPAWMTGLAPGVVLFAADDGTNGVELWTTRGSRTTTRLFKDLAPGGRTSSSSPTALASAWGRTLYFSADDGRTGRELWKSDAAGTSLVKDLEPGPGSSDPSGFLSCWLGGRALTFFTASTRASGRELWRTDGTAAGTRIVKDIQPGPGTSSPAYLTCARGVLFFTAAGPGRGIELWASDGTAAGTRMVKDIWVGPQGSAPSHLSSCNGKLFFVANDGIPGPGLWVSDGTTAGTALVRRMPPMPVVGFACAGDKVVFPASDGRNGTEPWITDGTSRGTKLLKDVYPGRPSSSPFRFVACGKTVFFVANDGKSGFELWATDLTPAGTRLVKDVYVGGSSLPEHPVCSEGKLFFSAFDPTHGREPWVSDGTAAGTRLVKDLDPGSRSSSPSDLTPVGRRVYFRASTAGAGGNGGELWVSDGTTAGTKIVCDLWPGDRSGWPSDLTRCGGVLYFSAEDPRFGRELFAVRRPGAMVERLGEGCPPAAPDMVATSPVIGGQLVLSGMRAPAGHAGAVALGLPRLPPAAVPFSRSCATWIDLRRPVVVLGGLTQTASWSRRVPIANNTSFLGARVVAQTYYIGSKTFSLTTTNGVLLTFGR